MSSCDCTISAHFKVAPSVTLKSALPYLLGFIKAYNLFPEIDLQTVSPTDVEIENYADLLQVDGGFLTFRLSCHCAGQDFLPDGTDELLASLDALAVEGGAVEIHNQDTPADAESTRITRFVGATAGLKSLAQIRYGMEQARTWLEPMIGGEAFNAMSQAALLKLESGKPAAKTAYQKVDLYV